MKNFQIKIAVFILILSMIIPVSLFGDTLKVTQEEATWSINKSLTANRALQAQRLLSAEKQWPERKKYLLIWSDAPLVMNIEYLPNEDTLINSASYKNGELMGKEVFKGKVKERLNRAIEGKAKTFTFDEDKFVQEGNIAYITYPEYTNGITDMPVNTPQN
jgi:hypothetical protein